MSGNTVFFFLFVYAGFAYTLCAQSLTHDTFGGNQAFEVKPQGFVYQKYADIDTDQRTGKKVVAYYQSEIVPGSSSQRDVLFALYDKDMTEIASGPVANTTSFDQVYIDVLINPFDGTFVVAWSSNHTGDYDVYIRKFSLADGSPAGSEKRVNSYLTGRQTYPQLALDERNNELIVAWLDQDGRDVGVYSADQGSYFRVLNYADFAFETDDIPVNAVTAGSQHVIAVKVSPVSGELYTVCNSQGYVSGLDIVLRKFRREARGVYTAGAEKVVNTTTSGDQQMPDIVFNTHTGQYLIMYTALDGNGWGAFFKAYDRFDRQIKNETSLSISNAGNQLSPRIAFDERTSGLICFYYWSANNQAYVKYQLFDAGFNVVGSEGYASLSTMNLVYFYSGCFLSYDQIARKATICYRQFNGSSASYSRIWMNQLSFRPDPNTCDPALSRQHNYVRETSFFEPVRDPQLAGTRLIEKAESVSYIDGFGRVAQSQETGASPRGNDLVQFTEYDNLHRIPKTYLPYVAETGCGAYRDDYLSEQAAFYTNAASNNRDRIVNDAKPYALTEFENAPSGRVLSSSGFGDAWQQSPDTRVRNRMERNGNQEVRLWKINPANGQVTGSGFYPEGTLLGYTYIDQDGNESYSYRDKAGLTVMTSVRINATTYAYTYYVYDELSRLRYSIPPAALGYFAGNYTFDHTSPVYDLYMYGYQYDKKGRLTEEKKPGKEVVYHIYDRKDRRILLQDGVQRAENKWAFVKFDALGRPLYRGMYTHTGAIGRAAMQSIADQETVSDEKPAAGDPGYTNEAWPVVSPSDIRHVYYYDTYDTDRNGTDDLLPDYTIDHEETEFSRQVYGRLTAEKTLNGSSGWIRKFFFYDKQGRVIQTRGNNRLALTVMEDYQSFVYDFSGQLLKTRKKVTGSQSVATTTANRFVYDHGGRLLRTYHRINGEPEVLLSELVYNELGQVTEKNLHSEDEGVSFLQSLDYVYNIQGAMTHINNSSLSNDGIINNDNNDLFGMQLHYEAAVPGLDNQARYNGAVSAMTWQTNNAAFPLTNGEKGYAYQYDGAGQLLEANYKEKPLSAWATSDKYREKLSYDLNGNIQRVLRTGAAGDIADSLGLSYTGNRLSTITEDGSLIHGYGQASTTGLTYDANGNPDSGPHGFNMSYNDMGKIAMLHPNTGGNFLFSAYIYSGTGSRLAKQDVRLSGYPPQVQVTSQEYIGNFMFDNGVLKFVHTGEGRVSVSGGQFKYEYDLKDHLGNTRLTFDKDPLTSAARVIQEDHYYPFGMRLPGLSYDYASGNRHLFQGKELDPVSGLYDFHARNYDPVLGRFYEVDPAGQFASPFNGMGNNPVNMVDPSGKFALSLLSKIVAGDINNWKDVGRAVLVGSITEPFIATNVVSDAMNTTTTSVGLITGLAKGIGSGDWTKLGNAAEIFLGQFYTDQNRGVGEELWQGISRNTLETPQTGLGYNYSQWQNIMGNVDRVDFLGGATFVTNEYAADGHGVSLGNFINVNNDGAITGNFADYVKSDPLYMHEYGHTFDSQAWGPLYLAVVGAFSAYSAETSERIPGTVNDTHDFRWYEMSANRHAAHYFGRYYGVDWNDTPYRSGVYETYYPRRKKK